MDGALPFLILILVIGASVGIAIGMSAIMSHWERSVPKPRIPDILDVCKSLAPGLGISKIFVFDSASTTFTRTWFIRDATTETVIAKVEYETNGDIILKMNSSERFFLENTEPPHRVCTLRHSIDGGIGKAILVRRGGTLRNADASYQLAETQEDIAITPKVRPLFPKKLVLTDPKSGKPLAVIAWLGLLTAGPFYMAAAGDLFDAIGEHGCCTVLIFESRRFF